MQTRFMKILWLFEKWRSIIITGHLVNHVTSAAHGCLVFIAGEYSCLKVDLLFKREFSYYLIQIYIPCCMLVIVSWVSFWLDQNAVPARVSLGVTTLLTMATQTSGINASLPPVSYTKAIDVWTGVCLTFVFGALLEFALVNYASRSDMHSENMKKQRRQRELEHAASLEAAADLLEDGATNFAMVRCLTPGVMKLSRSFSSFVCFN